MNQTRAVINLKEGIIELQGPVDFVRYYLDAYQFAIKEMQGVPKETVVEKAKVSRKRRAAKEAPVSKDGRAKRGSGSKTINSYLQDGFFDQPRSTREVRERLSEAGLKFTDNAVRTSLGKLSLAGSLDRVVNGGSVRYQRRVQP